jgi:hypothetical protein
MQQAQDPGHVLTEGLEPDHPAAGPQRAGWGNSSLRARMISAVLVAGVATVAVGAFGINRMSALSEAADVVYAEGTVPVDSLRKLQVDWWELQTHIARSNIEALPPESRKSSQDKSALAAQTLTADVEAAADLPLSPDAAAAFGEFSGATQEYLSLVAELQQIVIQAQEKAAAAAAQVAAGPPLSPAAQQALAAQKAAGEAQVLATMQPLIAQMNELEVTIVESATTATAAATAAAEVAAADARDAYESARTLTALAIAVGAVLSLAGGLLVARSVRRPVLRMRDVLAQVAEGDLTVRAGTVGGGAELGVMAASLDSTLDALGNVLGLVNDSAGRLAGASTQLNAAAEAMAQNARTAATQADDVVASAGAVASSVDTVATGSSQMESAIREIAHNATEAARVAGQAVSVAETTTGPSASWATPRRRSPRSSS